VCSARRSSAPAISRVVFASSTGGMDGFPGAVVD